MSKILLGGTEPSVEYKLDQAKETVEKYAFGTFKFSPKQPQLCGDYELDLAGRESQSYLYAAYDCPETSQPRTLRPTEIGIAGLLNARIAGKDVVGLMAVSSVVNEALEHLDPDQRLEDLAVEDVDRTLKAEGSVGWWMYRAWCAAKSVYGVGIAKTHKILHRLRPRLFPLIDGLTSPLLQHEGGNWAAVRHDLTTQQDRFAQLRAWFEGEVAERAEAVPLTTLRIHDVLLWMHARHADRETKFGLAVAGE